MSYSNNVASASVGLVAGALVRDVRGSTWERVLVALVVAGTGYVVVDELAGKQAAKCFAAGFGKGLGPQKKT